MSCPHGSRYDTVVQGFAAAAGFKTLPLHSLLVVSDMLSHKFRREAAKHMNHAASTTAFRRCAARQACFGIPLQGLDPVQLGKLQPGLDTSAFKLQVSCVLCGSFGWLSVIVWRCVGECSLIAVCAQWF